MANSDSPSSAAAMASAAGRFLSSLDAAALEMARVPFDDGAARRDWHYVPRVRGGLAFVDMTPVQQKAAYDLLASGTSLTGFAAAATIVALEDVLDVIEGGRGARRHKPEAWGRHRADYSTTIFGDPSGAAWGWRFEGHHLSVNVTVVDGGVSIAPLFLGANPARLAARPGSPFVTAPLDEEDVLGAAVALHVPGVRIAGAVPDDILTENASQLLELPPAEGTRVAEMDEPGRDLVARLIRTYLERLPPPEAREWWARIETSLGDVRVAYAGAPAPHAAAYYRVQGPHLLIEYDNTQNDANHIHTVLRDPERDFGDDALRRHRAEHAHEGTCTG